MSPLATLLRDIGDIVGGVPGVVLRYAATLVHDAERFNARAAERIDLERRQMMAAGLAAYHAGRVAGRSSTGSGAR